MTPTELATAVKETLLDKPNKKVVFTSFCNALGTDLLTLIEHLNKQVDGAKQKRITQLEAELAELKKK